MRSSVLVGVAVVALFTARPAQAAEAIDPERIAAVWKAREEKVRSVRMEIAVEEFWTKGGYNVVAGIHFKLPGARYTLDKVTPPADYKTTYQDVFVLDGRKARHDLTSIHWHDARGGYRRRELRSYDGQFNRSLTWEEGKVHQGSVAGGKSFAHGGFPNIRPVFAAFRGRTPGLSNCNPHDLVPTGRRQVIHGNECFECLAGKYDLGVTRHIWVCPATDWLIVRDVLDEPTRHRSTVDVRYDPHPMAGWVPAMWEVNLTTKDRVLCTLRYKAATCEINGPTEESEFTIVFPPGTPVVDDIRFQTGVATADGRLQPERGGPPVDLPGQPTRSAVPVAKLFLLAATAATLLILVVRVVRRYRGRPELPSAT